MPEPTGTPSRRPGGSTAHWGVNDAAAAEGALEERRRAFFRAYSELQHRISIFVSLPLERLDRVSLKRKLDEIGRSTEKLT